MVIRISPGQMAMMRELGAAPLVDRLFDHVERHRGLDRPLHPQGGRRMITAAVMTARRHGLSDAGALRRYAVLVTEVGEDLEQGPTATWAEPILGDPWLSDPEKIDALEQAAAAQGLYEPT